MVIAALDRLQSEVFDLGAEVATPPGGLPEGMMVLGQEHADLLIEEMDEMLEELPPLTSFILPGGSSLLASFHQVRVTVRRLERTLVALRESEGEPAVRSLVLVYVNRLSDWCFVMGRWCALRLGEDEVLWKPSGAVVLKTASAGCFACSVNTTTTLLACDQSRPKRCMCARAPRST